MRQENKKRNGTEASGHHHERSERVGTPPLLRFVHFGEKCHFVEDPQTVGYPWKSGQTDSEEMPSFREVQQRLLKNDLKFQTRRAAVGENCSGASANAEYERFDSILSQVIPGGEEIAKFNEYFE
jgi:hypothetical protein